VGGHAVHSIGLRNGQGCKQITAPLIPGHSYYIVLAGHAAATATHALTVDYDDVVIS
jgi:hypothetical protein